MVNFPATSELCVVTLEVPPRDGVSPTTARTGNVLHDCTPSRVLSTVRGDANRARTTVVLCPNTTTNTQVRPRFEDHERVPGDVAGGVGACVAEFGAGGAGVGPALLAEVLDDHEFGGVAVGAVASAACCGFGGHRSRPFRKASRSSCHWSHASDERASASDESASSRSASANRAARSSRSARATRCDCSAVRVTV